MTGYQYERLSPLDSCFLAFETTSMPMHLGSTAIFEAGPLSRPEGGIDMERVLAHVAARLHRIPRYRERLAHVPLEGHPVWIDDASFDLSYHVRHTSLPKPGNEQQLKALSSRLMSHGLDRAKPLWEVWVVEGLQGGRVAMAFKTHHCMVDGLSGVDILSVLMDFTPECRPEQPVGWIPRPAPGPMQLLRDSVLNHTRSALEISARVLRQPVAMMSQLRSSVAAVAETLTASVPLASDTPLNRPLGAHRRFDWMELDLGKVQDVKRQLGGTINDVVLATVAGAIRRFLRHRNVEVGCLTFRVFVPVSLRSEAERNGIGNRVAGWFVDLPIGEGDARKRHAAVSKATAQLKQSRQVHGTEILTRLVGWTGANTATWAMRLSAQMRPVNLVVTNIPGPPTPMYFLGARMLACYPFVPLFEYLGLGIALLSNAGKLFWGCNADWDLVPDLPGFMAAISASFRELCDLTATERAVTPATLMQTSKRAPELITAVRGNGGRPVRHRSRTAAAAQATA